VRSARVLGTAAGYCGERPRGELPEEEDPQRAKEAPGGVLLCWHGRLSLLLCAKCCQQQQGGWNFSRISVGKD
jgi:hypothetical protein